MAEYQEIISGVRPDGSSNNRVIYGATSTAISYYSISFLDTYKETNIKINNNEIGDLIIDNGSYSERTRTICEYNTWDDFFLIPDSAPIVPLSQVSPQYTDLSSWDGSIDETQALKNASNNGLYYQMISGNWEFFLDIRYLQRYSSFYEWYTALLEAIHGRLKIISLCKNQKEFYIGRVFVEEVNDPADSNPVTVSFAYNIQPYVYDGTGYYLYKYYKNGELKDAVLTDGEGEIIPF